MIKKPDLENYIARYNMDTRLLKEHPEKKELLEKRIVKHKEDIVRYAASNCRKIHGSI